MKLVGSTKALLLAFLLAAVFVLAAQHSEAYLSMEKKVGEMDAYNSQPNGQPKTTNISEAELNAYFAEGGVKLPVGVKSLKLEFKPAVVTGHSRINFDQLAAAEGRSNPFFSMLFTGEHDVDVVAQASGVNGMANVRIETVTLDGMNVPRQAMQYLVERYIHPKYPNAGLNGQYKMPAHIETAIINQGSVALTQR